MKQLWLVGAGALFLHGSMFWEYSPGLKSRGRGAVCGGVNTGRKPPWVVGRSGDDCG